MERFQWITLGIGLTLCIIAYSSLFHLQGECVAEGGQFVKAVLSYTCIK
jgi:hypothetical protein